MMLSIFNIGFSATVDGPGQRMVIYCKGCNLRCPWCASPESIDFAPQVLFYHERASDLTSAMAACPFGAIYKDWRDTEMCEKCSEYSCTKTGHPAFEMVGRKIEIDELVAMANRYQPFFGRIGGVTIGGGEPTCQFDSLRELLVELKKIGIHTAIETNGTHAKLPWLYSLIDWLYIDLKHPDPSQYPEENGDVVLDNIVKRHLHGGQMVVRIPLVSGYNADAATADLFGKKLSLIGPLQVELLPYHTRGVHKWHACGMPLPDQPMNTPTQEEIARTTEILQSYGLKIIR